MTYNQFPFRMHKDRFKLQYTKWIHIQLFHPDFLIKKLILRILL
jgi:hypothetical protein